MIACAVAVAGGLAAPSHAAPLTPAQLVGQRLMIGFPGTKANGWLLARIRSGQVGGVLLFSSNVSSPAQLRSLTATLQAAAAAGGQPKLLIATDQEGGQVKRIPWAPPNRSAQALGHLPASSSLASGTGTGQSLRGLGVNVNLAPVADVPLGPADFIQQQQRAFSTNRFTVSNDAAAFAQGLESAKVWPSLKHFPGLGRATVTTDAALVKITASQAAIQRDLLPYKVALRRGLAPMIMLSTAVYTSYSPNAAAWSSAIIGMLRHRLAFKGVTITDSIDAAAAVRHQTVPDVSLRCAKAGDDIILITGSQAASQAAYVALLNAAKSGALPMSQLQTSYARIQTLKARL